MSDKIDSPTTVQISKNASRQLGLISVFTNVDKGQLVEKFIHDLFWKIRPQLTQSLETGGFVDFKFEISAGPKLEMVAFQYPVSMDTPTSETDSKNFELISEAFQKLDREKELNKIKFKKVLEAL